MEEHCKVKDPCREEENERTAREREMDQEAGREETHLFWGERKEKGMGKERGGRGQDNCTCLSHACQRAGTSTSSTLPPVGLRRTLAPAPLPSTLSKQSSCLVDALCKAISQPHMVRLLYWGNSL